MKKLNMSPFGHKADLNEVIVFEYDLNCDVITFSDNIDKYIPQSHNISSFVDNISVRGKIQNDDIKKAISFFTQRPEAGKVKMEYLRFLDFSGEFLWYQLKGRIRNHDEYELDDNVLYGTMTYIDDEKKHSSEELEINRDNLTHVYNKDAMMRLIDEYLAERAPDAIPNLMLIDVDDYDEWKEKNSTVSADGVLIEIARILKRAFRGSDLIGRVGDDRFAIFMKGIRNTNILQERAAYVGQTVREVWKVLDSIVTVSVGIAIMQGQDANAEELFDRARTALLDVKHTGKDTYIIYNEKMERMEKLDNPILTTREMELVTNILDPMCSWAYAVDENYNILYRNEMLNERLNYGHGGLCYVQNKGYSEPCADCPIKLMGKNESSYDSEIYSPSMRCSVQSRTTKITLRNNRNIYLIASVSENIKRQEAEINESKNRVQQAVIYMQDIIWDVDVERNSCIRIKEENIKSVMDNRIKNYQMLREYFADKVVHGEDRVTFTEVTEPKFLKQSRSLGDEIVCREVRLKNVEDEYEWYNLYVVLKGNTEDRALIIFLNVNEYIKHRLENIETKVKYEIMKQKSDILKEMALNNERHENVNEMTGILVYEYYVAENEYYLCPMFDEVFSIDRKSLDGPWAVMNSLRVYEEDEDKYVSYMKEIKVSKQTLKTTVRLYNRNEVPIWYTIIIQPLQGLNNKPVRYLVTFQNVDAEMRIKMEMEYRADYDSVTGLHNAETFYQFVENYVHLHEDENMAIVSVDIDKFRLINDRYGIDTGNKCLSILGSLIKEVLPKSLDACRYQADVFNVMITYESESQILDFMTLLSDKVRNNEDLPVQMSLLYGIYKIVDINIPARLMCDRARAVKKQMKGTAISNYAVYDDVIRLKMREQAEIENEMELALEKREFEMFLQPQINISTGKICGAEALVRWRHPIKGILVPSHFLSLFEDNGFITKLDLYIWKEACKYIVNLQERGIMLPISVNVSRRHIGQTDIVKILPELVGKYGFENRYLEVEITENLFIEDVEELFDDMARLKSMGFRILMDDFGSGYSSLNMLRTAPVDTMKIDRYFLDEIMSTERGRIIVESSVRMAKELGLEVIAEGVETKEQLDFLASINCDIAQGYYYSRPIPVGEFEEFLKNYL
ncbi:MAG: EAL domain-containing protein [Lachnospiraceae bacterium]|nr:EAL domain-containing protein [Lachnospiraceae bacterium]